MLITGVASKEEASWIANRRRNRRAGEKIKWRNRMVQIAERCYLIVRLSGIFAAAVVLTDKRRVCLRCSAICLVGSKAD